MGIGMGNSISALEKLVNTYIFADAYDLPVLKDSVIDGLIELQYQGPIVNIRVLDKLYETPSAKSLQKFLVDFAVHNWCLRKNLFSEKSS